MRELEIKFTKASDSLKLSQMHGGDSRYWERDDRRRDEDYNEKALEHSTMSIRDRSIDKSRVVVKGKNDNEKIFFDNSIRGSGGRGTGLYNEVGRDELKINEAEYEASLKNIGQSINEHGDRNKQSDDAGLGMHNEEMDVDDEYDDGIDSHDARMVEDGDNGHENGDISNVAKSHDSFDSISAGTKDGNIVEEVDESSSVSSSLKSQNSRHLVEPLESRKFARFSLQYTAVEEKRLKMSDAMLSAYDRELYQCKLLHQWNCGTSCTVYGMHYDGIVYEAVVTWNTLIDSHCKSGHHNKAELFEAMRNSGEMGGCEDFVGEDADVLGMLPLTHMGTPLSRIAMDDLT
uniref:Uncharacterized protein n=1 Tax=Vitis vinifera TaxID=29760 RepID=A5BXE1_VITVI|nr:hypothetical protein VITISV_002395 [Vitis vinifera]